MAKANRPPIKVVPYDAAWPNVFAELKAALEPRLDGLALTIEHTGSTSIPGLAAKPIIDLIVVIATRDDLPAMINALAKLGYWHEGDLGIAGREAFAMEGPDVPRDGTGRRWPAQNLYVAAADNAELRRHKAFRDYLRAHPDSIAAYARLKEDLAARFPHDIDSYSRSKTEFVEDILRRAREA